MKKVIISIITIILTISSSFAFQDRYSKEYLQNKKHIAVINPVVEAVVEKAIKKELKKQTGSDFKVKFTGYTTSSVKKGIFKYLEISGEKLIFDTVPIEYAKLKTISDYNYIDYKKNPFVFKSDMTLSYDILLTDDALNVAMTDKSYQKVIDKVNHLAYPMFTLTKIKTKIVQNRLYIIMDYNFPIARSSRTRTFVASTELKVENGRIYAENVNIDSVYGNLGLNRVANLINLLNPLEFTLKMMDSKDCKGNIENVNIVDNKIKVDGKIFISGDKD